MALTANVNDPNRKEVQTKIKKLKDQGTAEAADKLKAEHNIDAAGKSQIVKP